MCRQSMWCLRRLPLRPAIPNPSSPILDPRSPIRSPRSLVPGSSRHEKKWSDTSLPVPLYLTGVDVRGTGVWERAVVDYTKLPTGEWVTTVPSGTRLGKGHHCRWRPPGPPHGGLLQTECGGRCPRVLVSSRFSTTKGCVYGPLSVIGLGVPFSRTVVSTGVPVRLRVPGTVFETYISTDCVFVEN